MNLTESGQVSNSSFPPREGIVAKTKHQLNAHFPFR
jgi:hypothetical protein